MLNILPKFELEPIKIYWVAFSTVRRPSITPSRTLDDLSPELTATMHQCIVRTVFCQSPIGVSVGEAARLCMEAAQQLVERKIPGELNPHCSARCAFHLATKP
jgi:hypothetical protein